MSSYGQTGWFLPISQYIREQNLLMTIRNLLRIILKIIGLLFVRDFIIAIPQLIAMVSFLGSSTGEQAPVYTVFAVLLVLLTYFVSAIYLIRHTDWLIDKLDMERGFDVTHIELKLHRSTVLSISLIVIGGWLAVSCIPDLLFQLWDYYHPRPTNLFSPSEPDFWRILPNLIKIFFGILLMSYHRLLVNLIEKKRVERDAEEEEDAQPVEENVVS